LMYFQEGAYYQEINFSSPITYNVTFSQWFYKSARVQGRNDFNFILINRTSDNTTQIIYNYYNQDNGGYTCQETLYKSSGLSGWHYIETSIIPESEQIICSIDGVDISYQNYTNGITSIIGLRIGQTDIGGSYSPYWIEDLNIRNGTLINTTVVINNPRYPSKVFINISNSLSNEYNYTNNFSSSANVSMNISLINSILSSGCTCFNCSILENNCNIPINFHSDSIGILQVNLTNATYSYGIDNCTTFNNKSFIFSLFDENYPSIERQGTAELEMFYGAYDNIYENNYTTKYPLSHNFSLCIYPTWANFYTNLYLKYTDGFTHSYYLNNFSLTNNTVNINIYNWNTTDGSSDLKITTRNILTYAYYQNVYAQLQRKYLDTGSWITVQMAKSGAFGNMFFNIKEETIDYRIKYYDVYGNILKETGSSRFSCVAGICEYTELINPTTSIITPKELKITKTMDNATGLLTLSWDDPTLQTSNIRLQVTKETMTGTAVICSYNVDGYSGSYICNTTGYTGDLLLRVWSSASSETPVYSEWLRVISGLKLDNLLGSYEGAFWSFGIMLTAAGAGALLGIVGAIVMVIVGMIVTLFLGTFSALTITLIIIASVIGIVIGIKVRQ